MELIKHLFNLLDSQKITQEQYFDLLNIIKKDQELKNKELDKLKTLPRGKWKMDRLNLLVLEKKDDKSEWVDWGNYPRYSDIAERLKPLYPKMSAHVLRMMMAGKYKFDNIKITKLYEERLKNEKIEKGLKN